MTNDHIGGMAVVVAIPPPKVAQFRAVFKTFLDGFSRASHRTIATAVNRRCAVKENGHAVDARQSDGALCSRSDSVSNEVPDFRERKTA